MYNPNNKPNSFQQYFDQQPNKKQPQSKPPNSQDWPPASQNQYSQNLNQP